MQKATAQRPSRNSSLRTQKLVRRERENQTQKKMLLLRLGISFAQLMCTYLPILSPPKEYTQTYYAAVLAGWWGSGGGPAAQPVAGGRWQFLHILGTQPQSH
uniref:Uncharacterized protein n=1 Tax=Sus scrofa TaxID=9823 RepID=A0A8D1EM71_PIG